MVSRLGARRWKLLHRLAYAVVLGAVIHFWLLVKSDLRQPIVFGAVFAAMIAYRIALHYVDLRRALAAARQKAAKAATAATAAAAAAPRKRRFWSGELRVARIFDETHDVKTFRFVSPDGGPLPFENVPGQYLNLALEIDGKRVNRSYTIASSPTRGASCEISVKRIGLASSYLHDSLREGHTVKGSAPAGKFHFAGQLDGGAAQRIVLIAGGVGITPMMSIARSLTDRSWPGDIYLLFANRTRADIIFESELAYLQQRFPNLHVLHTLSREPDPAWTGARGHVTREMLEGCVPELRRGPVMLGGPDPKMAAMRELLVALGVPDAEIHQEAFASPAGSEGAEREASAAPATAGQAAAPGAAATAVDPIDATDAGSVRFLRAGKTADLPAGLTVLEAAEEAGVSIPFECRSGICGQCKTRLVSGRVAMENQDALTPADRSRGLILACQARAAGGLVVDA
jgi:ferredoxin-NADP reductase